MTTIEIMIDKKIVGSLVVKINEKQLKQTLKKIWQNLWEI
jgi:F0F1-type ATP synthase delta subunit